MAEQPNGLQIEVLSEASTEKPLALVWEEARKANQNILLLGRDSAETRQKTERLAEQVRDVSKQLHGLESVWGHDGKIEQKIDALWQEISRVHQVVLMLNRKGNETDKLKSEINKLVAAISNAFKQQFSLWSELLGEVRESNRKRKKKKHKKTKICPDGE